MKKALAAAYQNTVSGKGARIRAIVSHNAVAVCRQSCILMWRHARGIDRSHAAAATTFDVTRTGGLPPIQSISRGARLKAERESVGVFRCSADNCASSCVDYRGGSVQRCRATRRRPPTQLFNCKEPPCNLNIKQPRARKGCGHRITHCKCPNTATFCRCGEARRGGERCVPSCCACLWWSIH